jgi:uncharacterized protein (UPF0128 family)
MKNLNNIGLTALENIEFNYEERFDFYKKMVQKFPLFDGSIKPHDAEAIADIVISMGSSTIEKVLEEVNQRAAVLNNPIMGQLLLVMVMANIRRELKNLEEVMITLLSAELNK